MQEISCSLKENLILFPTSFLGRNFRFQSVYVQALGLIVYKYLWEAKEWDTLTTLL